jgi:PKD repeat protein
MKRFLTLLWLTIAAFSFKATAQTTNCNAEFSVHYLTNNTVKFIPVVTDSPLVRHFWSFGDGSTGSQLVSPTHTYSLPGTYAVVHTLIRFTPNNVPVCTQSFTRQVTITAACNLVANFSWSITAANPLTVAFQNLSTPLANSDSIRWTFGDGTSSTAVSPVHTYAAPGTYTVCLRVKKWTPPGAPVCVREICKTVVVPPPCNLVIDFNWNVTPTNPLRIEFHAILSTIAVTDSIRWTFGDGTSGTGLNPVHTYNAPGTYTVCLKVIRYNGSNIPCIREICKTIVIPVPCNLVANFTSHPDSLNPLKFWFTNTSVPIHPSDSVRWTFGDGTSISGLQSNPLVANPTHTYANAGVYNVCLRIKKNNSTTPNQCVREICRTITVPPPCNLVVNFTAQPDPNHPLRIKFTNTSTPIAPTDSLKWTFGDGTSLTGVQSDPNVAAPTHNYAAPGNYTVCLTIKKHPTTINVQCIRSSCRTVTVLQPCNLVVNFTSQPDPNHPLRIKFTNTSTPTAPTDSLKWTFGDGTSLSGLQSDPNVAAPTHNYTSPGNYTVCLTVKKHPTTTNVPCIRSTCRTITVLPPCNLVVNFTAQPDPNHPLRIKFTNTSTPTAPSDSLRWTFGDGTTLSGLQSDPNVAAPTHIYAGPGNYRVCLRVKKQYNSLPAGICVREKCDTVVVRPPCNFVVNFSWRPDSVNPRKIIFTNLSVPPTAAAHALWTFGDGTSATTWNAVHEYAQPGRYRVCLKIFAGNNTTCVREICDTVYVQHPAPPCNQLSRFRFERFPNDVQKYKFIPDYINPALQYTWTFGDGTGSQDPIAVHRYAQPGIYVACLTVWRGPNCASTTCKEIRVEPQVNCDTAHAWYTYQRNPQMPNKIQFYANATLPILDQTWTFTRVPNGQPVILHQNNPLYTFQDTGLYKVCLRAVLMGGCVKEYCSYIRIEHISSACTLQAFPNPASVNVNVNVYLTQPEMIHAYVYNSQNVLVRDKHQQGFTGNNLVTIDVHNLPAGQYNMKVITGNRVCYATFQKL